jgi:hypothetical protein
MLLNEKSLTYPILCISPIHNILYYSRTPNELIGCNTLGLKSGFYTNLEIIDSLANRYRVLTAVKTNDVGRFWGFNVFLERKIQVTLTLEELPKQSFEVFKKDLLKTTKNMESYGADSTTKKIIRKSTDYIILIESLIKNYYGKY